MHNQSLLDQLEQTIDKPSSPILFILIYFKHSKLQPEMAKQISFDAEPRQKLKNGIDALANAVRVTLGPKGRNVVIQKSFGAPSITKDGVTVAKEVELEDPATLLQPPL